MDDVTNIQEELGYMLNQASDKSFRWLEAMSLWPRAFLGLPNVQLCHLGNIFCSLKFKIFCPPIWIITKWGISCQVT